MTHPHLEGLIRKWREDAQRFAGMPGTDHAHFAISGAITSCADELSQALAALPGGGVDDAMAMHWIDRYAAGIDDEPQIDLIREALTPAASSGEHVLRFGPFMVSASNEGGAWSIVVAQGRKVCAIVDETGIIPAYTTSSPTPTPHEADRNGCEDVADSIEQMLLGTYTLNNQSLPGDVAEVLRDAVNHLRSAAPPAEAPGEHGTENERIAAWLELLADAPDTGAPLTVGEKHNLRLAARKLRPLAAAPAAPAEVPYGTVCIHDGQKYIKWTDGDYHYLEVGTKLYTAPRVTGGREVLWCLHLRGPDDVHAAPSYEAAQSVADQVNARFDGFEIKVAAVAAPWPYSAESHAESLKEWEEQWIVPAALQAATGGEVGNG